MAAKKKKTPSKKPSAKPSKGKRPAPKSARGGKRTGKKAPLTARRRPAPKRPVKKPKVQKPALPENKEGLALAVAAAKATLDKKAEDVVVLDVRARGASVGYDYLVLASGDNDRLLEALADAVEVAGKALSRKPTSIERSPDWVLVNFDDVIVHLFTPDKRGLYDLEGFWSDAPRLRV